MIKFFPHKICVPSCPTPGANPANSIVPPAVNDNQQNAPECPLVNRLPLCAGRGVPAAAQQTGEQHRHNPRKKYAVEFPGAANRRYGRADAANFVQV